MITTFFWIAGGSLLSFGISALFAGRLQLERNRYLGVYVPVMTLFMAVYFSRQTIGLWGLFASDWQWGLVGALAAGAIVVANVFSQDAFPRRRGREFVLDLIWPGLTYGVVDAMLLSVFPVVAIQRSFAVVGASGIGGLVTGVLAMLASMIVTFFYHVGYPEFRNRRVLWTVFGNAVMTLAFLVTGSPLAAILPHAAMHIAVVCHGRESTGQLPPHYPTYSQTA